MAYKLPSLRWNAINLVNCTFFKCSTIPHACTSCALIRNSSTFLLTPRTGRQMLVNETLLPNTLQVCEKSYNKSKKTSQEFESDSDSEDEEFLEKEQKRTEGAKVVQVQTYNLRIDAVIKQAFGISRNKCEVLFYENKIRINGKKPLKKSTQVSPGDEVDVIKGLSEDNENFILISRAEVLKIRPSGDYLVMTMRKQKTMVIENYKDDAWVEKKETEEDKNPELG